MSIPENVKELIKDEKTIKVLTTVSKGGQPHAVTAGSLMLINNNELFVAEIFMNKTSNNMQENDKVAVLLVNGMESYILEAKAIKRYSEGDYFDVMTKPLCEKGLPVKAIWTFEVTSVYDQSATPNAGKKLV